jgi:hypothetical protein
MAKICVHFKPRNNSKGIQAHGSDILYSTRALDKPRIKALIKWTNWGLFCGFPGVATTGAIQLLFWYHSYKMR